MIRRFMAREYAPARMVLAAAGDVEHAQIVDLAERLFGAMPAAAPHEVAAGRYTGGERRAQARTGQSRRAARAVLQGPRVLRDPSLCPSSAAG